MSLKPEDSVVFYGQLDEVVKLHTFLSAVKALLLVVKSFGKKPKSDTCCGNEFRFKSEKFSFRRGFVPDVFGNK